MARKGDGIKMTIDELKSRLETYPGPHPEENWKKETDLTKCTAREKQEILRVALDVMMGLGLTRGEVHHMLFGYRFSL